jgi:hypothetical protein
MIPEPRDEKQAPKHTIHCRSDSDEEPYLKGSLNSGSVHEKTSPFASSDWAVGAETFISAPHPRYVMQENSNEDERA